MTRSPIICPACGETNPPQFDVCWSCGAELQSAPQASARTAAETPTSAESINTAVPSEVEKISSAPALGLGAAWLEMLAVMTLTHGTSLLWHAFAPADLVSPDSPVVLNLLWIPRYIAWSVILWILVRRDHRMVQPVRLQQIRWRQEIGFGLLIFVGRYMVAAIGHGFGTHSGMPILQSASGSAAIEEPFWISMSTLLFSAIYEEMLFRVYLQSRLQTLLDGRVAWSIVLSALVFAVIHRYALPNTIVLFLTGVLYGAVYQSSRRVPRLAIAHWLHNLLVLALRH